MGTSSRSAKAARRWPRTKRSRRPAGARRFASRRSPTTSSVLSAVRVKGSTVGSRCPRSLNSFFPSLRRRGRFVDLVPGRQPRAERCGRALEAVLQLWSTSARAERFWPVRSTSHVFSFLVATFRLWPKHREIFGTLSVEKVKM